MPERKTEAKFISYQLTINNPKEHHLEHDAIKQILSQIRYYIRQQEATERRETAASFYINATHTKTWVS